MRMSSRNTAMPESNILENRLSMICMDMAGAFIRTMGITTHLYILYLIMNVVFGNFLSAIWYCQYLLQRLIDVKYFTLPFKFSKSLYHGNGYKSFIVNLSSI